MKCLVCNNDCKLEPYFTCCYYLCEHCELKYVYVNNVCANIYLERMLFDYYSKISRMEFIIHLNKIYKLRLFA